MAGANQPSHGAHADAGSLAPGPHPLANGGIVGFLAGAVAAGADFHVPKNFGCSWVIPIRSSSAAIPSSSATATFSASWVSKSPAGRGSQHLEAWPTA